MFNSTQIFHNYFFPGVVVESSGKIVPATVRIRPRSGRRRTGHPRRDVGRRKVRDRGGPEASQGRRRRYFAPGENRNPELGLKTPTRCLTTPFTQASGSLKLESG